ncbi:transposase, IS605 OrfB [Geobacillus genomosp. 3]|uniref:Transposase, IS605 OrfB n=1 Tax=Geobacillus genomosp. 3 TaxID=1921421 RepID=V5LVI6_GEOG3|nr:transposase, IS605 OrfB [Geobacillus genomosp. 3]
MKDVNHKISRQMVNFALANGVGIIRMEELTGIRKRAASTKEAGLIRGRSINCKR